MMKHLCSALLLLLTALPCAAKTYSTAELKKMFEQSSDTPDIPERTRLRMKIAQAAPDSAYGLASRAFLMRERLTPQASISIYTKALELDPDIPAAYFNRGAGYVELRQYDKAIKDYEKYVSLKPALGAGYQGLGDCYMGLDRDEKAIEYFGKALRLDPSLYFAYNNRGALYMRRGEYDKAIADLNAALKLAQFAMAYMNRADAWAGKTEYQKALADYKTAESMIGPEHDLLVRRGRTYLKMGEYAKAREDAGAALEAEPGSLAALGVLGRAAFSAGDYTVAEDAFKRYAAKDAAHAYAMEQLYNVYAAMKRRDLAEEALKKALEREPGRKDLKDLLVKVQIRNGNAQGTEDSLTAVIDSGKAEDADYFNRAEARLEKKDYKGAEADLKLVLKRNPDSNSATVYLALAFLGSGRRSEAMELFSSVADTDPARLAKLRKGAAMGDDLPGANVRRVLREMLKLYDGAAAGEKPAATASAAKGTGKRDAAAPAQEDCYCVHYTGQMPPYFIAKVPGRPAGCEKVKFTPDASKPGVSGLKNCEEFQEAE